MKKLLAVCGMAVLGLIVINFVSSTDPAEELRDIIGDHQKQVITCRENSSAIADLIGGDVGYLVEQRLMEKIDRIDDLLVEASDKLMSKDPEAYQSAMKMVKLANGRIIEIANIQEELLDRAAQSIEKYKNEHALELAGVRAI